MFKEECLDIGLLIELDTGGVHRQANRTMEILSHVWVYDVPLHGRQSDMDFDLTGPLSIRFPRILFAEKVSGMFRSIIPEPVPQS